MAYDEVYVSIERNNYRKNKANMLNCQANLLHSLKILHNLSVSARQKADLKRKLHTTSKNIIKEINLLKEKLPDVELPKEVKKELKEKKEAKKDYTKRNLIDEELKQIQEKLEKLNKIMV
jgi:hypothetical protein